MRPNPKVAAAERNKDPSGHVDLIPAHFGAEVYAWARSHCRCVLPLIRQMHEENRYLFC
jgi:hypothetical protein